MAPQYKLYYFDFMGLAETIRLIFAFANVEYEDIRINKKDWPGLKKTFTWGKLPALQLPSGHVMCQSSAIARYLARKYNLIGESEEEAAKCDEYAEVIVDLRQEIAKHFNAPSDTKAELEKQLLEATIPKICTTFHEILEKNGSSGFLVGDRLTYADISLAFMLGQIRKTVSPTYLENKFPEMEKYEKMILNQPGIKEWVSKRPDTIY